VYLKLQLCRQTSMALRKHYKLNPRFYGPCKVTQNWQGRNAHCQIVHMGFDSYLHIANVLISVYCKCANLEDALYIFVNIGGKDIVSWNSMIAGYARHGLAVQGIELFERMKNQGVKPDAITFLGVSSSCWHAGFVERGKNYFNSMVKYGVKLELDHYSCIVGLLGHAG